MNTVNQRSHATTPDYSGDPQLALLIAVWEDLSAVAGHQVSLQDAFKQMQDMEAGEQHDDGPFAGAWDETDAEVTCD